LPKKTPANFSEGPVSSAKYGGTAQIWRSAKYSDNLTAVTINAHVTIYLGLRAQNIPFLIFKKKFKFYNVFGKIFFWPYLSHTATVFQTVCGAGIGRTITFQFFNFEQVLITLNFEHFYDT